MSRLSFRFYAELNAFLQPQRRDRSFEIPFNGVASVKDAIESVGVPHPEVAFVLINGAAARFTQLVQHGDRIEAFPASAALDVPPAANVDPHPAPRFILDVHLGRLAEYLRLLGFDTLYRNDYDDQQLAEIASRDARILLTRDLGLLKRSIVTYGYYVRQTDPPQQVLEILRRFNLFDQFAPFRRCMRCNGLLHPIDKASIVDQLQPQTRQYYDEFQTCEQCRQIYWKGSHYERMERFIEQIKQRRRVATND